MQNLHVEIKTVIQVWLKPKNLSPGSNQKYALRLAFALVILDHILLKENQYAHPTCAFYFHSLDPKYGFEYAMVAKRRRSCISGSA